MFNRQVTEASKKRPPPPKTPIPPRFANGYNRKIPTDCAPSSVGPLSGTPSPPVTRSTGSVIQVNGYKCSMGAREAFASVCVHALSLPCPPPQSELLRAARTPSACRAPCSAKERQGHLLRGVLRSVGVVVVLFSWRWEFPMQSRPWWLQAQRFVTERCF